MHLFPTWFARAVVVLAIIAVAGIACVWWASERALHRHYAIHPEPVGAPSAQALADAPRQARLFGCPSCHGEGLRGHRVFDVPGFAAVYAPNLTLLAAQRTDEQLAQALRQGVAADGRGLHVMPSRLFARLDDDETAAMIAYVRSMPQGGKPAPCDDIRWRARIALALGEYELEPDAIPRYRESMPIDLGPEHARARHITATVCSECHGTDLGGDIDVDGTRTPDLAIVAAYDLAAFTRLLRTGVGITGRDLGVMAETARNDLRMLTDEEIAALHAYLHARADRKKSTFYARRRAIVG